MIKISIAGFLLYVAMVLTAITASHNQPAYARGQQNFMSTGLQVGSTRIYDAPHHEVLVSGESITSGESSESGGVEGNPFVICIGLVAIASLSFGFLRHHQILEARRKEEEAEQTAQRKANQFGTRPVGKEPPR